MEVTLSLITGFSAIIYISTSECTSVELYCHTVFINKLTQTIIKHCSSHSILWHE